MTDREDCENCRHWTPRDEGYVGYCKNPESSANGKNSWGTQTCDCWERENGIIKPIIICLCGSTKFKDAFTKAQLEETLKGKIVLTIGCNMKSDQEIFGHLSAEEFVSTKRLLDQLHFRKIEMADEVLILNVGGYIGLSTCDELNYARALHKRVILLERP